MKLHRQSAVQLCMALLHFIGQCASGLAYMGSNHRLRAALRKGLEGKGVLKIGVIGVCCAPACSSSSSNGVNVAFHHLSGGSISDGHGASSREVTGWVPVFSQWVTKAFKNSTIRNGSIPGTPSVRRSPKLSLPFVLARN
jgi:hypothetical protein